MFGVVILVGGFFIIGLAAQSHKYPAGLDPATCPNYPLCDNGFIGVQNDRHAVGTHAMAISQHHFGGHFPFSASPRFFVPQAAPGYPVGLSPAACPNYPYCSHHIPLHYNHGYPRNYPSGVSAHHCPNYPFCHYRSMI